MFRLLPRYIITFCSHIIIFTLIFTLIYFIFLIIQQYVHVKTRNYNNSYELFGFTFITERDGTQKPLCFICGKVLANGSMKPAKLKEHFVSLHPQHVSDNSEVFQTKKARFEKSGTLPQLGFLQPQKPCLSRHLTK